MNLIFHRAPLVCAPLLQSYLEACCSRKFETRRLAIQDAIRREEELLAHGGHEDDDDDELDWFGDSRWEGYKKELYCVLERPQSSPTARVLTTYLFNYLIASKSKTRAKLRCRVAARRW